MKGLGFIVAFAVVLIAAPAFAGDVSNSTLASLGLGGLQSMSDAEGMQVRGLSSQTATNGGSLVSGALAFSDGTTVNFIQAASLNIGDASDENAGVSIDSLATQTNGSGIAAALSVDLSGVNVYLGALQGVANGTSTAVAN